MSNHEQIRVAQIMGKLWAGGVEMVVFNYYRAIDKTKIQFDFYYDADSTVEPPQELIDMGARFIKIPPYQKFPSYMITLHKHFTENKYQIVHSHINTLSVFPLFIAWICNIPVRIAHNHSVPGGREFNRNALKYFLRLFAKLFSNVYFACSEKAGRWMFGDKDFNNGKVIIIKNATDFNRFRPSNAQICELKEKLGFDKKFVIGHIGRFTFAKNHQFLLDVFKQISKLRDEAVLLLVGDGELHKDICEGIRKRNLGNKVVISGQVSDPEVYYGLADVVVVPSIFEGLSLTTIESQIAGVPVVASKAVPKEAIISDGVVRLSLENINDWVNTILEMGNKTITLDERSRNYDIYTAVRKLEKCYKESYQKCQKSQL